MLLLLIFCFISFVFLLFVFFFLFLFWWVDPGGRRCGWLSYRGAGTEAGRGFAKCTLRRRSEGEKVLGVGD